MHIPSPGILCPERRVVGAEPHRLHAARLRLFPALLSFLLLCLGALPLHAQFNASLRGVVTDPTGALIPGATVTLVDTATNRSQTATSNGDGIYTFNSLAPAPYKLTVSHTGFQTKELAHVEIIPEQANQLNITMEVGAAATTVTVSSVTRGLPTETATESSTISSQQIQNMPSFNRDVFQLAELTPGVTADASQGSGGGAYTTPGNQGVGGSSNSNAGIFATENGVQLQDMGGQYETNGISIDGISTTSAVWGGASVITPSEDSVEDMHIVANSYDAENGRFSGAQIEVTTKSGTNEVHGSAFFKASRPGLNAYQRWNGLGSNHAPTGTTNVERAASRGVNRDNSDFNQYGGSLGGPFWKNRLFGFFNYETSPLYSLATSQGWYETPQFDSGGAVAGSIASKYLAVKGEGVAASSIVPRTCASIGLTEGVNCATINGGSSGLDVGSPLKTGLGMQDLTYGGSATAPGVGGGLDGIPDMAYYNTVNPTTTSQAQYNGRMDANVSGKDRLTFTIYWVPLTTTDYDGPVRSANLWHHTQINDAFSVIWNHTFSPTLLNQARANAAGWRYNELASNPQEPFGFPQDNIDAIGTIANQDGFQPFGAPGPGDYNQWTYGYNDVLTKMLGRHSIKAGGELTRLYYLNNALYAARPQYNFHNLWDFSNDAPYHESGTFNYATGVPFSNRQDDRENLWGFFGQDDYKVRSNLTLNLGLRWSYFGAFYSKESNLSVLNLGTGTNALTGMNIHVGGGLYTPPKDNFGPQVGFSWQPMGADSKAVLRGGIGVNYNQNEIAILANGFGNPPFDVSANFTCPYPFPNPTCAGTGILYETASSPNSIFGFAPNPATITAFSPANLPLTGTTQVTGFPSHPRTITDTHYSLEADYQLPLSTIATLGYQGNQIRHLLVQNDWIAIAAQNGLATNPVVNFVDWYENSGNSNYNAMVATLTHSFAQHFQGSAQYTWGKELDELSGPYYEDPYPYDTHAAYGRAAYNVQNALKIFGLWQPVLFHGHSWAEKIAGGWSLSGIWNWHTGFPWDPTYNTAGDLYYQGSPYTSLRPTAHLPGAGTNTGNQTFMGQSAGAVNPDFGGNGTTYFPGPVYTLGPAFPLIAPGPAPGIHRDSLNGPDYNDVDGTLAKDFGLPSNRILGEHAMFEVRADAYNFFNRTNISTSTIDTTLGSVAPGTGVVSPNSDFGNAGGALAGRQVQLQARFSF